MFFFFFTVIFAISILIYMSEDNPIFASLFFLLFLWSVLLGIENSNSDTKPSTPVDATPVKIETKIDDQCTLVIFYPEGTRSQVTKFVRCDNATVETLNTKRVGKTTRPDPITTTTK